MMPHALFTFHFWEHAFYAFLGAGLLYMRWGRSRLRAFAFSDFLDTFDLDDRWRVRLEMFVFIIVGTFVAIGVTQPSSVPQAFTAGLGWTGLVAKPEVGGPKQRKGKVQ